jgi:hypothetical protein
MITKQRVTTRLKCSRGASRRMRNASRRRALTASEIASPAASGEGGRRLASAARFSWGTIGPLRDSRGAPRGVRDASRRRAPSASKFAPPAPAPAPLRRATAVRLFAWGPIAPLGAACRAVQRVVSWFVERASKIPPQRQVGNISTWVSSTIGGVICNAATSRRLLQFRVSHAAAIRTLACRGLSRHLDRSLLPSTLC